MNGPDDLAPPQSVSRDSEAGFRPLDPLVRKLWLFEAVMTALFITALLAVPGAIALWKNEVKLVIPMIRLAVPIWSLPIAVFILLFVPRLLFINAHYRRWKYRVAGDEVTIEHGVLTQSHNTIPRGRIQHVDVSTGVVQRALNLASVSIYTAGSMGPTITIPGVNKHEADAIRRELMERSR
jgi:membrane protein YdbS with pleckstrin-like domain